MKIAIPLTNGVISAHFGHCEQFAIIDADKDEKKVINIDLETPPPHEPGLLPRWLAEKSVELVIAGGLGQRAQSLFKENNIDLIIGVVGDYKPEEVIELYLNDNLQGGQNLCEH